MRLHMLGRARHRLDDARRALVERADEVLQPLLTQQLRRLLALLRQGQLLGLAAAELEDVEGARHLAHLMGLAEERHLDIELAVGQHRHAPGDDRHRLADTARDAEGESDGDADDAERHRAVDHEDVVVDGVDIVDVDAGAGRPLPGIEAGAVGQLGQEGLGVGGGRDAARARIAVADVVAATLRGFDLAPHGLDAVHVGRVDTVLALDLAVELHHRHAVIALDEEVVVVGEAQPPEIVAGAVLRLFPGDLSRRLAFMPGLDHAQGDMDEVLERFLAVGDEALPEFGETEEDDRAERGQEHWQEQHQP